MSRRDEAPASPASPAAARPSPRTRVRRLPERARYDRATIDAILDEALVAHVAYLVDGAPVVTPTLHWRDGDRLYLHGSGAGRMVRALVAGGPACIAVTLLDGLVLARSGFHHSANYRSVMVFGTATAVTDPEERRRALDRFIDARFAGRAAGLRPATATELKATAVLWLPLDEASAKVRTGPPTDDPGDLAWPAWAGVLPLGLEAGTPERAPDVDPALPVPACPTVAAREPRP